MRRLLQHIVADGRARLGAVLHAGAGACGELEAYRQLNARKIILVEADPDLAARLRARAQAPQITVVHAAVTAQDGPPAVLRVLNNPRESTVMPATRLLEQFPNLRVTHETAVETVSLSRLIEQLAPTAALDNLLVLETPGAEFPVLSATKAEDLQKFAWIAVRSATGPLYDGAGTAEQVHELLVCSGFRIAVPMQPRPTAPFQSLLYQLDDRRVYSAQAAGYRRQLAETVREKQNEIGEKQKEIAELVRGREEREDLLVRLEAENNEFAHRQGLLDQELLKAEAQVELIKDLLLREETP
jgi:FkbM family methyltransferase